VKNQVWIGILVACAGLLGWLAVGELRRKGRPRSSGHDGAGGDGGWFDGGSHAGGHGGMSDAGSIDSGGGDGGGGGD
jgi:hypothetical protein